MAFLLRRPGAVRDSPMRGSRPTYSVLLARPCAGIYQKIRTIVRAYTVIWHDWALSQKDQKDCLWWETQIVLAFLVTMCAQACVCGWGVFACMCVLYSEWFPGLSEAPSATVCAVHTLCRIGKSVHWNFIKYNLLEFVRDRFASIARSFEVFDMSLIRVWIVWSEGKEVARPAPRLDPWRPSKEI